VLTAAGDCAHFGFSTHHGETVSVASNTALSSWLKRGIAFMLSFFRGLEETKPILPAHQAAWRALQPGTEAAAASSTKGKATKGKRAAAKAVAKAAAALQAADGADEADNHDLRSPHKFVGKSLNTCPLNFSCSMMRGLYADMHAMEHDEEPVCEYPELDAITVKEERVKKLRSIKADCKEIVRLIHDHRPWINRMLHEQCEGCTEGTPNQPHSCMRCLCRAGPNINEMMVDLKGTVMKDEPTRGRSAASKGNARRKTVSS